jgi:hypothetical protein
VYSLVLNFCLSLSHTCTCQNFLCFSVFLCLFNGFFSFIRIHTFELVGRLSE